MKQNASGVTVARLHLAKLPAVNQMLSHDVKSAYSSEKSPRIRLDALKVTPEVTMTSVPGRLHRDPILSRELGADGRISV